MTITCILVEDEPLAIIRAKEYISKFTWLDLKGVFDSGADALRFLRSNEVDLIFLDINIGAISGLDLLESISSHTEVIFTTAYHEFALKGYEFNITDYLLKPYTFERFTVSVERARSNRMLKKEDTTDHIFVKSGTHLERINFGDILYIEGMGDYRRICTETKKVMTLQTFYELEKLIPRSVMCRIHKSYMVAIAKIDSIEKEQVRVGGKQIPVSETYKHVLKEIFKK